MNGKRAPHHVALIDGLAARRIQLRDRLEQGGCSPVLFEDLSELLVRLCGGRRFDLLLIVEEDISTWAQLVTVCDGLGMPILVLLEKFDLEQPVTWAHEFPTTPLFDFALVDCQRPELNRRMFRLLQRGKKFQIQPEKSKKMIFGDYEFHEGLCAVSHHEREIHLQPRQFQLALELFRNVGRVLDRNQLRALLWGKSTLSQQGRAIDVCVASIRKKLALFPENGFTLNSIYGRGYLLLAVAPLKAPASDLATATRPPVDWAASSPPPLDWVGSSPH